MPPARSGVADYAVHLLEALKQQGHVEVAPPSATLNLYHLGNNQLHAGIYGRALAEPGLIVLHDAVLHHFVLGYLSRSEYIDEFVYNYGEWTRDLAAELWASRAKSAADARYFAYPLLRRILERSRGVIVHNPAAAEMVRRHLPSTVIFEIPHLLFRTFTTDVAVTVEIRNRLGVSRSDFLCGIFGYLRESKRIRSAIRACERTGIFLLLAGDTSADLEHSLAAYLESPWIRRIGPTGSCEFRALAHSVDACINLRYPQAGETSGIGVNMMGIGKPVIFTDSLETSRYPAGSCARISSGVAEPYHLEQTLLWLKNSRDDARAIGDLAARYIRTEHSPEKVSELYWQAIRAVA
jgi:hypothetical protein